MNEQQFIGMMSEHQDYIYRFAFYLIVREDEAKELTQRTWIKAWQHRNQLHEHALFKSWIRKICLNEFRMMVRSNKEVESVEELEQDGKSFVAYDLDVPLEITVEKAVKELRNGCFLGMASKLTDAQRVAFSLVDMFGLSLQDTALLMEISVAAVKGLLVRARNNLESFFGNHCMHLKIENACDCHAWLDFNKARNHHQHKLKMHFSALEFQELEYVEQSEIRQKMMQFYHHIPTKRPSEAWFRELQTILKIT